MNTMLYNSLKIFHILSATLLMTSISYCYYTWIKANKFTELATAAYKIQAQTWSMILPFITLQLATGFYMLSLKHEDFTQFWIVGSVISFIIVIGSWFSFIYALTLSQQLSIDSQKNSYVQFKSMRVIQSIILSICALALFSMIFLMTNKIN